VFAYNLTSKAVQPILLSPLSMNPVTYRYPSVLDDGTLLIVGIVSTEGPTYKLNLAPILH
jgi:hypothetical protein